MSLIIEKLPVFLNFARAETIDTILASDYDRIMSALKAKLEKMGREPGSDDE